MRSHPIIAGIAAAFVAGLGTQVTAATVTTPTITLTSWTVIAGSSGIDPVVSLWEGTNISYSSTPGAPTRVEDTRPPLPFFDERAYAFADLLTGQMGFSVQSPSNSSVTYSAWTQIDMVFEISGGGGLGRSFFFVTRTDQPPVSSGTFGTFNLPNVSETRSSFYVTEQDLTIEEGYAGGGGIISRYEDGLRVTEGLDDYSVRIPSEELIRSDFAFSPPAMPTDYADGGPYTLRVSIAHQGSVRAAGPDEASIVSLNTGSFTFTVPEGFILDTSILGPERPTWVVGGAEPPQPIPLPPTIWLLAAGLLALGGLYWKGTNPERVLSRRTI